MVALQVVETAGAITTPTASLHLLCRTIASAPVRLGIESDPVLLAPAETGGWTIGAWDGRAWYDLVSGAILQPAIYVELPSPALMVQAARCRLNRGGRAASKTRPACPRP